MRLKTAVVIGAACLFMASLVSCSSGGGGGGEPAITYVVSGSVSGLTGTGLVLQNNGTDDLPISSNTTFTFTSRIAAQGSYAVTVKTHPSTQSCFVSNGTGTATADVTNVRVVCHASGSPDAGFGTSGIVTTPVGTNNDFSARAVAVQADGKIVAAGTGNSGIAVVRYKTDGTLDSAFGANGIVSTLVGTFSGVARSVAIQSDQKIVAAGSVWTGSKNDVAVVRLNADGTLDNSFGISGIVSTPVGTMRAEVYALAIQSDNKILAAGYFQNASDYDAVLLRYLPNGELDSTFGSGGIVILNIGPYDEFEAIALQPDNKILAAGGTDYNGFLLVRYLPNGTPDTTFGTNGIVLTDIAGAQDFATAVIRQPDGKIVLAGSTTNSNPALFDYTLVRYNENGSIDTAFGTNGMATVPILCNNDFGATVALQSDGKIVIAAPGSVTGSAPFDTIVVRYLPNGTPDTGFGTNSKVTESMGASEVPYAMAIQADGMILVAGVDDWGGSNSNFALLRLYP